MKLMKTIKNNYITNIGFQRLEFELNHLLYSERPELLKIIQWAASNGDRSENADYLYGKKRLREIDRRIRFLQSRINSAVIINPENINSQKVLFGATVKIVDQDGVEKSICIVGVDEVNTSKGHLSWQSPIGKALLGKEINDEIEVDSPSGKIILEILEIKYMAMVN
jgi:transcription elongation factor GreB